MKLTSSVANISSYGHGVIFIAPMDMVRDATQRNAFPQTETNHIAQVNQLLRSQLLIKGKENGFEEWHTFSNNPMFKKSKHWTFYEVS